MEQTSSISIQLPRPANGIAVLTLVLVFLGGAASGAVLMRLREHRLHVPTAESTRLASTVDEWNRELDLSEEQRRQIVSILDDFSVYYDNVLSDGNSRIMQVLRPDQQKRFQQMLSQRRR